MLSTSACRTVAILLSTAVLACSEPDPPTGPGGPEVPDGGTTLASGAVPSGGGTITVQRAGHALDGLTITVPGGAYPGSTEWSVSVLDDLHPTLPTGVVQIGPAIKLHNGESYAAVPFLITLPARVGPDSARTAFFYDPASGTFELIPTMSLTDSTLVVVTRHVSADQLLIPGGRAALRMGGPPAFGEVVVVVLASSDLLLHERMDSGFRPGTDDWEFPNYGSHLEPHGFCTGSTLSALYYHYALKSSRGALNGRFDLVDGAWQDNPNGIRLASVIQSTMDWNKGATGMNAISDSAAALGGSWVHAQAASLSMSIKVTGRPQQLAIYKADTTGGHAVIAFATQWGLFFIADPNEPGVERHIEYELGAFKPFPFSTNASVPGEMYNQVFVMGVTALVPITRFENDWRAFDDSTIGDAHFKATIVEYLDPMDTVWTTVGDTVVTVSDTLIFRTLCPTCPWGRGQASTPPFRGLMTVLDAQGATITSDTAHSARGSIVQIPDGRTTFGLAESGIAPLTQTSGAWKYQDYASVVVQKVPFELAASTSSGGVGDEIDFTVEAGELETGQSAYHWDFGDGSAPKVIVGNSDASHTFDAGGTIMVKVELRDAAGVVRGRDSVSVAIGPMAWRFDSVGVSVSGAPPGTAFEVGGIAKVDALVARITATPTDGILMPFVGTSPGLQFLGAPAGTGLTITSMPDLSYDGPFYSAGGHEWEVADGNAWLTLGSMSDGTIEGAGWPDWMFDCIKNSPAIEAKTVGGVMRGVMTQVFTFNDGSERTYVWTFRAQPFAAAGATLRAAPAAGSSLRRC